MRILSPKCPRPFRSVAGHAERFSELVVRLPLPANRDEGAAAWLTGRADEVRLVFELAFGDWASGARSAENVVRSMTAYLLDLHAGVREAFGVSGDFACCDEDVSTIVGSYNDETRVLGRRQTSHAESTEDTWFDPSSLLGESERASGRAGTSLWPMAKAEGRARCAR
jgi:hypothetical protein